MKKRWRVLLACAVCTALVAGAGGCGARPLSELYGQDKGGAVKLDVPDEEKAKDIIDGIDTDDSLHDKLPDSAKGGLKMANSVGYPPMEMFGKNGKDIIGVDPALAYAMAKKVGVNLEISNQEFPSMIPGMKSGRYDLIMSSMTDNADRRKSAYMIDYVRAGNAFLVKSGNPDGISKPTDVCGKSIAVVQGGSSEGRAKEIAKECKKTGKPTVKIMGFEGDAEANVSVKSGRNSATLTDYPVAAYRAAQKGSGFDEVQIKGGEALWAAAVDRKNKPLADALHAAMQSLIEDGTYMKILKAWDVDALAIKKSTIDEGE